MSSQIVLKMPPGTRLACVGKTGTGKSFLARQMFLASSGRRIVIDPYDSELTEGDWPSANTTAPAWGNSPTWRIVPRDPLDLHFYDTLYKGLFNMRDVTIWCDELTAVTTSQVMPEGVRLVILQGRKRRLTHIGCSQRPAQVHPQVWANTDTFAVFKLPWKPDRQTIAGATGLTAAQFEDLHSQLGKHGFIWNEASGERVVLFREGLSVPKSKAAPQPEEVHP